MQSECAKFGLIFFDLIIRWPKSSHFGAKSAALGHQFFKSKNWMGSKINCVLHSSEPQQNER